MPQEIEVRNLDLSAIIRPGDHILQVRRYSL
jgi:hypothetical protein